MSSEEKELIARQIEAELKIIATLPPYNESSDRQTLQKRARHQKNMADNHTKLELIAEEERIATVVRENLELHPYMMEKDCPICLETLPLLDMDSFYLQSCCGGVICGTCITDILSRGDDVTRKIVESCPLCRGEFPRTEKARAEAIKRLAKKGNVMAQHFLGGFYLNGLKGFPVNKKLALKWFRASKDHHPASLFFLGNFHRTGDCGVEKSEVKFRSFMKEAADAGYIDAQDEYAYLCWWGTGGEVDRVSAARYASLRFSHGDDGTESGQKSVASAWILGSLRQFGEGGLDQSQILAKHYLQLAVDRSHTFAYFQLAQELINENRLVYDGSVDGNTTVPGFCPIPKALYLARKALAEEGLFQNKHAYESTRNFIEHLEAKVKHSCANCNKAAWKLKNKKLMCCAR